MSDEVVTTMIIERLDRMHADHRADIRDLKHSLERLVDRVGAQNGRVTKLEIDRQVRAKIEEQAHEDDVIESADITARATRRASWIGLWALASTAAITGVVNVVLDHWK